MSFPWWVNALWVAWIAALFICFVTGWFWIGIFMLCLTAGGVLWLLSMYAQGMSR